MHCKRNHSTLSVYSCIRRQQLIREYKETISKLKKETDTDNKQRTIKFKDFDITKLEKCLECKQGAKITDNPDVTILDVDVRKLKNLYMPKPKRYKLQIKYKKHHQMEIKCPLETKRQRYLLKTLKNN